MTDWLHLPSPLIIGHRGASADAPENTLPSVKLGFEHGASLHDPEGRLRQGASKGKQLRYYEIHSLDDIDPDAILGFLVQAIRLKS